MPERYDSRSGDHTNHQFPSVPFTSMSIFILEVDTGTNNMRTFYLSEQLSQSSLPFRRAWKYMPLLKSLRKGGTELYFVMYGHTGRATCAVAVWAPVTAELCYQSCSWRGLLWQSYKPAWPMITPTASKHLCMGEAWLGPTDSPHSLCDCVCLCERSVKTVCFVFSGTRVEIFQMKVHVCVWLYVYVCVFP